MKTLKCPKCGESKLSTEFHKQLGQAPMEQWNVKCCKKCSHLAYIKRISNPDRLQAMKDSSNNWKLHHPKAHNRLAREYRKRNPEKTMAQNRLNYAIRKGKIKRQPCEECEVTEKVHAHHASYEPKDWYNVNWLCFECHKTHHKEIDQKKLQEPSLTMQ